MQRATICKTRKSDLHLEVTQNKYSLVYFYQKEIQLVLDAGASPDRIIFAHPYKQESHLRFAQEKGVRLMTFDTEEELYKVKRVHPEAQ